MKAWAVVFSLVPGLGHIVLGRCVRGLLLFFLFTTFLNGLLLWPAISGESYARKSQAGFLAAAGLLWLYAVLDAFRIAYWRKRRSLRKRKLQHLRTGLGHYLRDEWDLAREEFRQILRKDRDDPDAHFHLGMVYKAEGRWRAARRHLRRSVYVDELGKWRHEVAEELEDMKRLKAEKNGRPQSPDGGAQPEAG